MHVDNAETVARTLANALEGGEQTRFDVGFECLGFFAQLLFFRFGLRNDFVEFRTFQLEILLAYTQRLIAAVEIALLEFDEAFCFADFLFQQFDFQPLEFDFLRQVIVFAVVAHVVELLLIARHHFLRCGNVLVFVSDVRFDCVDLLFVLLQTVGQSLDLVFQILHFERKFAAQSLDFVNLGKFGLQLVEVFQLLFHRQVSRIFFFACHMISGILFSRMRERWHGRCALLRASFRDNGWGLCKSWFAPWEDRGSGNEGCLRAGRW